jgi:very-short-patch-repair endonuclease
VELAAQSPLRQIQVPPATPDRRLHRRFHCDELKLAIELDGAQHECIAVCEVDDARTLVLHGYGIEIVRISNRLLARDPVTAAESIQWAIDRAVARTR